MRICFFLCLLLPVGLFAQTAENSFFIEVIGESQMDVKPDVLKFSVTYYDIGQSDDGFSDFGNGPVSVSIETAEKILLDLAQKHGVEPEKQISDKYNVISEGSYGEGTLSLSFVFKDLSKLDGFVEDLRAQKIFNGSLSSTSYTKEVDARRELRKAAFEDARAKAEELAAAMGKKLGHALQIWDETPTSPQYVEANYYYGDGAGILPTTAYGGDPTKNTLYGRLRVRFAFY